MLNFFVKVARDPFRYIEFIIALLLIIGGLYIGSPFYLAAPEAGATAVGQALSNQTSYYIFAFVYALPGLSLFYGLIRRKDKWVELSLYWCYVLILFTVILILATTGLRPLTWLTTLSLGLISAILWIRKRYEKA